MIRKGLSDEDFTRLFAWLVKLPGLTDRHLLRRSTEVISSSWKSSLQPK